MEEEGSRKGTNWSGRNWRAEGWSTENTDWGVAPPFRYWLSPLTGWALWYQFMFPSLGYRICKMGTITVVPAT